MKASIFLAITILTLVSCQTKQVSSEKTTSLPKIEESESDSLQYDLIIFDIKFDSFLAMQPSMEFYSQEYYENWNYQYVTEWSIRHDNPIRYGDFYQTRIDYEQSIDYGMELNYKLYYYFLFIEKEYGITLIRRAKTAM
ncbi:DUF6146 family protein [Plebeiibacterium sediminum]|uniref:DUF6146 family protein n=1 Tax=Plebeiibacterium sediminum TaxID=2992112 RepID=A0AAE3M2Q4_9BACT|nr:DUF6146 family protein [Plebeiobacterium sediminum]MCW3786112.1 DUF6146 family protein [Plebeiobacterium sediminum]